MEIVRGLCYRFIGGIGVDFVSICYSFIALDGMYTDQWHNLILACNYDRCRRLVMHPVMPV